MGLPSLKTPPVPIPRGVARGMDTRSIRPYPPDASAAGGPPSVPLADRRYGAKGQGYRPGARRRARQPPQATTSPTSPRPSPTPRADSRARDVSGLGHRPSVGLAGRWLRRSNRRQHLLDLRSRPHRAAAAPQEPQDRRRQTESSARQGGRRRDEQPGAHADLVAELLTIHPSWTAATTISTPGPSGAPEQPGAHPAERGLRPTRSAGLPGHALETAAGP